MIETRLPSGLLAASLTPFHSDGFIHHDLFARHAHNLLRRGCDGLLLYGTTGEGLSLTVEERTQTLDVLLEARLPADRLLVGASASAMSDIVHMARHATKRGVGGVLVPPLFHVRGIRPEGVFRTYDELIQHVGEESLRLYVHHDPALTGVPVSTDILRRLVDAYPEQIVGIMDSGGDWEQSEALCQDFSQLQIFIGSERYLLPHLKAGGAGGIFAMANLEPSLAVRVAKAWQNDGGAAAAQRILSKLSTALASYPMVPALKAVLAERCDNDADARSWPTVRAPLTPLTEDEWEACRTTAEELLTSNASSVSA